MKKSIILLIYFSFTLLGSSALSNTNVILHLDFRQLTTKEGLPTDEVQKVFQDKDGWMWFATRYGFCKYNGYEMTLYKSNLYSPNMLTNNNIFCLADDYNHNLWVGTQEGLNVLDKKTGNIRKYLSPALPNNIVSCLLVTRKNEIYVGTDYGLCRYVANKDSFAIYDKQQTGGVLGRATIKSLFEDSDGDIWIGTWASGLYRYSPVSGRFYAYPKINEQNSAHVIYEDDSKNIWVGGWNAGLFRLSHPKDVARVTYTNYRHKDNDETSLSDDVVYDISEDPHTHTLWVGTRSGLSIMVRDGSERFINYKSSKSSFHLPCDEINSIICDHSGNMWIGSIGGGVLIAGTHQSNFVRHDLSLLGGDVPATFVRSLFADSDKNLWLGIGSYGLARLDNATGRVVLYSHIPEFSDISSLPSVYAMLQRKRNGEIWFGTYDGGIFIYKKGEKVRNLMPDGCRFLPYSCVSALYEDKEENCWVGTRGALGVRFADGSSYCFRDFHFEKDNVTLNWYYIRDIIEDTNGTLWLATSNYGLIHLQGNYRDPQKIKCTNFSLYNKELLSNTCLCLHSDKHGRLWVGTEGGGLYLYNRHTGHFEEKNRQFNIPGDMVGSIEEDDDGSLWMGTNAGLVKLTLPPGEEEKAVIRVYTVADGLQDNFFISHSSCQRNGELFFGGYKGYNSFFPNEVMELSKEVCFGVTDIKIFNRSLNMFPSDLHKQISDFTPAFTHEMRLPYKYNNFSIEFASFTYKNPDLNQYAYMLVGFDKEWQYTDASHRFAYYSNLKSGTYKFLLKATNENGIWSNSIREISITVLPPFWNTWWAYAIYVLLAGIVIFYLYRTARNRILLRNQLQLREMEKAKSDELNHAKLQFFTNITHELLSPLTIISATTDELKMQAPGHDDLYAVMGNNIRRLIRLLQQILEFRKVETGNLKLRVSKGDIALFVKNEAESFKPLIRKHKIHFSVLCNPECIIGYFDTDKLDKILYNLLSNAAKYNKEEGYIQVTLSYCVDNQDFIFIRVKDNGQGISKERQKTLFQRFYEGDYRKFNTIGTGIGLSLVKDLVELHGGVVTVKSEIDQGTEFQVKLPIDRSYFKEEQIDEDAVMSVSQTIDYDRKWVVEEPDINEVRKGHTLLIVEDNEELLSLMVKLLGREYNVFTAENGKEAITMLENEDIDLIVSDVMMPEMDGIELCKQVKSKLEISHIPVILLTAKNKEEDRVEAYEVGADAYISKPFNLTVLYARIRNLLRSKERVAHDFKNQIVFEIKDLNYTTVDEDFIQRAIACVHQHLEDCEFDQPQFMEEMGTSKSTLYKKLKSLTGLNTSAFIRNIRLKAACRLMEEKGGGVRISELAYAVGFNDPKYFSSCFKKEFGLLPSEYAERFVPYPKKNGQEQN